MKFVLAGNYEEYQSWRSENPSDADNAIYINNREALMGLHNIKSWDVVKFGTFHMRKDCEEIERELMNVCPQWHPSYLIQGINPGPIVFDEMPDDDFDKE